MASTHFTALHYGTVSVNPGSIATIVRGSVDVTVAGISIGDMVTFHPPDALNTGLAYAGCRITADNTVRLYLVNVTAGALDDTARTWDYEWWDRT